jgi:hypothetical protein
MSSNGKSWQEKEWERYVNQLLATHHAIFGGSYQPVPDLGGDHGLEGFTTDTGEAYQAYADQDSKNNNERTRKQKKKIHEDLAKLEKYSNFWQRMLGDTRLKQWTLLVPDRDDKEVVKYAKTKARQLAKKGLPFIDPSFFADVKTADDFPVAKAQLRERAVPLPDAVEVTDEVIDAFQQAQPEFIRQLRNKLSKVSPTASPEAIDGFVDHWLRWHLKSANLLEGLQNSFPMLWESLDELIDITGQSLETDEAFDSRQPSHRLRETRQEFETTLGAQEFDFLSSTDRTKVSYGVVAKWLGECPLDFSGESNG